MYIYRYIYTYIHIILYYIVSYYIIYVYSREDARAGLQAPPSGPYRLGVYIYIYV